MKAWTKLRRFVDRRKAVLRVATLIVALLIAWVVAWQTGLLESLDVETIRTSVLAYGWAGVVIFILACCVLNLLHVPAMVMIVVAIVAWGPLLGSGVGWLGALTASCTTFTIARFMGGRALGGIDHPWARRMLEGLERRPLITLVVLRTFFQASAPLNVTLALTTLRFRPYLIGSALGLTVPVLVAALLTDLFV
ncbi:MAG: TVP38/TMEM64 family protein [Deltaproteobacteria bacterium]|nr:MAG: TVP38/TMEM64 family protein [Deltaproteobacteria bacterium]